MSIFSNRLQILVKIIENEPGITTKEILNHQDLIRDPSASTPETNPKITYSSWRTQITFLLDWFTYGTATYIKSNKNGEIIFRKILNHKNQNNWYLHDVDTKEIQKNLKNYTQDKNGKLKIDEKEILVIKNTDGEIEMFIRQRDGKFAKTAKELFYEKYKAKCEMCGKIFKEEFALNFDYIEMHHKQEFSKNILSKEYSNIEEVMEDFMYLCPNCHRAIHLREKERKLFERKK